MDARALLRAKKAGGRVEHPHAAYSTSGQLRCSICAIPVKQWDAHLMTKQHRQSVAREQASSSKSKRPAEVEVGSSSSKRSKPDGPVVHSSILPAGFFSNGSGPMIVPDDEEEEVDEGARQEETSAGRPGPSTAPAPAPASASTAVAGQTGDEELDSFLASLAEPEPESEAVAPTPSIATQKAKTPSVVKKGTSSYKDLIPGQASYEAAPVRNIPQSEQTEAEAEPEARETEEERRAREAREEREEVMDRLDEEARAQEDADQRVAALKARMEALKKRREGRTKAGPKATAKKEAA